jgi:bifunctional non-homologous end joining protein LigD
VAKAVTTISAKNALLDGETVVLDHQGWPSFQMLQHRASFGKGQPVVYYAFDLLNLNGRDLTGLPLHQRKELLSAIVKGSGVLSLAARA